MGNSASKSRTFAKEISENAPKAVKRSEAVNQLPPPEMRKRFEQSQQIDQSNSTQAQGNNQFDAAFLKKKLSSKEASSQVPSGQVPSGQVSSGQVPSGKDGFDPHEAGTSTYNDQFLKSINQLGKQIHSHSVDPKKITDSLAVRQLQQRKNLFNQGKKEEESESSKTMVSPKVLASILNDVNDPRVADDVIIRDYKLNPEFITKLGHRFKVAKNVVLMEEKVKEGEIGHKMHSPTSLSAQAEDKGADGMALDQMERYNKLKSRISLDD